MTALREASRRRTLAMLAAGVAGLSVLMIAFEGIGPRGGPDASAREGALALPDFASGVAALSEIEVTLADGGYTLRAADAGWIMADAGGFPIRTEPLSELVEGLATLRWAEAKTRDPAKFDRLGLGAPEQGGAGALLEARGGDGAALGRIVLGRRGERFYARLPDEAQTFRVDGALPPLYSRAAWLDLNIVDMQPASVAAVTMRDESGRRLRLAREPGGDLRDFRPAPPFQVGPLVSRLAAATPALALTRFAPIGVKPAAALATEPVAQHVTATHDGLEVALEAFREAEGVFVTLRAVEAGEGAARAETINARAAGWAFELSRFDWNEFTTPVDEIVQPGAL